MENLEHENLDWIWTWKLQIKWKTATPVKSVFTNKAAIYWTPRHQKLWLTLSTTRGAQCRVGPRLRTQAQLNKLFNVSKQTQTQGVITPLHIYVYRTRIWGWRHSVSNSTAWGQAQWDVPDPDLETRKCRSSISDLNTRKNVDQNTGSPTQGKAGRSCSELCSRSSQTHVILTGCPEHHVTTPWRRVDQIQSAMLQRLEMWRHICYIGTSTWVVTSNHKSRIWNTIHSKSRDTTWREGKSREFSSGWTDLVTSCCVWPQSDNKPLQPILLL